MKRFSKILPLLLLVFFLGSCDRDRATGAGNEPLGGPSGPPPPTPPPATQESRVRLYLFAAGFCGPCKHELPIIRDWLEKDLKSVNHRVLPLVVFVAGNPANIPAKQEDADKFKSDLQIPFPIVADKYGKQYYRQFYPAGGLSVPAITLLKEDFTVIKIYTPAGQLNLDQLGADINEALK